MLSSHSPKQQLLNAISHKRLAHALLFVGNNTALKDNVAMAFVQTLLCPKAKASGMEGCGTCHVCLRLIQGTHPNLQTLYPEQNVIKVDSIRRLTQEAKLSAFEEGPLIFIIKDAHCLNTQAANALLKSLEEPLQQRYFILFAPSKSSLLSTIASRLTLLYFPPSQEDSLFFGISAEQIAAFRAALFQASTKDKMAFAETLSKDKEKATLLLECMQQTLSKEMRTLSFDKRSLLIKSCALLEESRLQLLKHANAQLVFEKLLLGFGSA